MTDTTIRRRERAAWQHRLSRTEVKSAPYVYVAPFFLVWAIVGAFPVLYTAWIASRKWNLIAGDKGPVGWDNFAYVLTADRFWIALRNTFSIFLISSVPQIIIAIFLAAILDANLRARTFWRMGVLIPYVVAPVAAGVIFGQLFADKSGLINAVLHLINLGPIGWHSDVLASHFAVASIVNFRWIGYNTLIFLAAMQAVPSDVVEAAVVDGASRWKAFWSVTIPMLRPTMIFVIVTSTIGGLQIFDEPRMFDGAGGGFGGSSRQWMTVTMYLYELGWGPLKNLGRAAAVAWLLFLIIVVFALINFAITRRIASSGSATPRKKVAR